MDGQNPYAPPQAEIVKGSSGAESLRQAHLRHEASLKSAGSLYYCVAAIFALTGVAMAATLPNLEPFEFGFLAAVSVALLSLGVLVAFVGRGLRTLRSWVRIPVGILSGFGLLSFPLGTLVNGYILYLVFNRKGAMVLSDEYAEIVRQTPHLKYRTPLAAWIVLAALLAIFVSAIVGVVLSS